MVTVNLVDIATADIITSGTALVTDGVACNPLSILLEGTSTLEEDYEAYYSASPLDINPEFDEREEFLTNYTDGYKVTVTQIMAVAGKLNAYNGMCFTTNS